MAWYPEAVRKQLTVPNRAKPSGRIAMPTAVRINLHTAVSNSYSLAWDGDRQGYFNTTGAGGVFSHFYVRKDGVVEQMQDTAYRSSCDLDGNPDTISIESWDGYKTGFPGYWATDSDVPPWNAAQVASLIKLVAWIYATHPSIPRKLATSNRKGYESRGLSYHRVGVPGYALYTQAEGGLYYTNSYKKGCPGNRRIAQIPDIHRAAISDAAPQQQEAEVITDSDVARIAEAARAKIFEQRMTGPEIDPAQRPTLHDYLVQVLPARTAVAVHGQWLGSSGPTIGVALQSTYGLVRELADRAGVDIDEAALAAAVVSEVAPQLIAAIIAKLDGVSGVDPAALAAEVVAELGSKLAA